MTRRGELRNREDSGPIHIMHVLNSFHIGGLENGVVNLINRMDSNRYRHSICCIRESGKSADRLSRNDTPIHVMSVPEGKSLMLPVRLARLLRKCHVHVVHTRNWGAMDGILAAGLARIPAVVHSEHGRDISDPDGSNRKRILVRKGLSILVDHHVAVSEDLRRWLVSVVGLRAERVQAIPNGVDVEEFSPAGKISAREEFGLGMARTVYGSVGRLDPVKDYPTVIRAFTRIAESRDDLALVIIGDGPCKTDLMELVRQLGVDGKVRFLGERTDIASLLRAVDVFVLGSLAEGLSNTALEAMATGLPLVVTDVGGNSELVVQGETGWLVEKGNPEDMATAMDRYLADPSMILAHGKASRNRAVNHYSLGTMVATYEAMYGSLASTRQAGSGKGKGP